MLHHTVRQRFIIDHDGRAERHHMMRFSDGGGGGPQNEGQNILGTKVVQGSYTDLGERFDRSVRSALKISARGYSINLMFPFLLSPLGSASVAPTNASATKSDLAFFAYGDETDNTGRKEDY
jgi:hypothetical protein